MPLQNTFILDVDFKVRNLINEPLVTQNDEVKFILNVFDDGKEFELSNVSTFTLASVRPDKVSVMSLGKLTGPNQVTFELGSTELLVPGTVDVAIQLYDTNGRISTLPFTYKVLKDPVKDYIPSADEQTLIELVLGQGPVILAAAEKVAEETLEAEALRVIVEGDRVSAENQRILNELGRVSDESERETNEIARIEAETLRKTAEDGRVQAEADRQTNTSTAIQNVETATTEAIDATNAINLVLPNVLNLEYIAPYNDTIQYEKNNMVSHGGSSFISLVGGNLGNIPIETPNVFWGLLARKGLDGLGSVVSVNGVGPDANGNVTITIPDPDLSEYVLKDEIEASNPVQTIINRGSQVINTPIKTPVSIVEFKTIVNYAPLFDSGAWDKGLANITVNNPNKVTLIGTANSQSLRLDVAVKEGQVFTFSHKGDGYVIIEGGSTLVSATKDKIRTFTIPIGVTSISIYLTNYTDTTATYFWEDFIMNEGTTPKEFVANVKGVTNPTLTNTGTGDSLTVQGTFHTGDVVDVANKKVTRAKREVVLDGSLGWQFDVAATDFKRVSVLLDNPAAYSELVTKFNGKILKPIGASGTWQGADSTQLFTNKRLYISIANAESGWGPNYTPTQAEIQAYFNGWKMYDVDTGITTTSVYNRTNGLAKAWGSYDKVLGWVGTTILPTTKSPSGINGTGESYRLIYDLVTPVTESVKTIGSLRLTSGDNTVELTEGRIVRERVYPKIGVGTGGSAIFNLIEGDVNNPLKHKIATLSQVYKNGEKDRAWNFINFDTSYGGKGYIATIGANFDPTAIYEVEYTPLEPYKVSAHATPITIKYRDMLGGVTEELVEDVTNLTSRISSNESVVNELICGNSVYAKKTQGAWRTAILQNGWANTFLYRINSIGQLEVRYVLVVGTTTNLITVTNLGITVPTVSVLTSLVNDSGEASKGYLYIDPSGLVKVAVGASVHISAGQTILGTAVIPLT
ncbi:MAG: hypothetical protein ABS896_09240 [Carnobacterium inhibens]|uniref:hypothetical protein n=1 Tax=Carnobacterium inhibens TaxID=147709 RepID=UPI0033150BDF